MPSLKIYQRTDLLSLTALRNGESKLGQTAQVLPHSDLKDLEKVSAKWVLLGVPEDIGVRANKGVAGANSAFKPALQAICNVQSNSYLNGEELLVLGEVDCTDLMDDAKEINENAEGGDKGLSDLVEDLDEYLANLIETIVSYGKTPILIGGGHNNAYPRLKGASHGFGMETGINCFNCDPHSDFRELEGRHSGNGFSYAYSKGYLRKYFLFGYHENYNNQHCIDALRALGDKCKRISYDAMVVRKETSFDYQLERAVIFTRHNPCGIEIDLDSIQNMPSSAMGPSGFTIDQMRTLIYKLGYSTHCAYLHLAEGAPALDAYADKNFGKAVAYLVTDFLKAQKRKLKESIS